MNSILTSIKRMLGIAELDDAFDEELVVHINSAISVLTQLGVGPETGFRITGISEVWDPLLVGRIDIDYIKQLVYCKCRLSFDPPQNSFLVDSIKKQADELEWRIEVSTSPNTL